MGKSNRLRLRDLRDAYRLIGECRDLGDDVRVWREHMLRGLCHRSGPGPRQREARRQPSARKAFGCRVMYRQQFPPASGIVFADIPK